jgi:dCMP deaminase
MSVNMPSSNTISSYSWDSYFMTMAYLVAMKSKDPSTKVGSVVIGPDKEIRATGYNGLPRNLADLHERYEKPLKLFLINHAEENAILHASRVGVSIKDCTIYVPWFPCSLCAKSIIQSGINQVVYHTKWPGNQSKESSWAESMHISREILQEAGVIVRAFDGDLIPISAFYDGTEVGVY